MTMPTKIDLSKAQHSYFTNILLVLLLNHGSARAKLQGQALRIAPLFPLEQLDVGASKRTDCEGAYVSLTNKAGYLPTIKDIDPLIYLSSWLCHAQTEFIDRGLFDEKPHTAFRFDPDDYYRLTCKAQNGRRQSNFEYSLQTLHNTILATNCLGNNESEFRLIENYSLEKKDGRNISQVNLEIHPILAYCLSRVTAASKVPTEYFALRILKRALVLILMEGCFVDLPMTTSIAELRSLLGNQDKSDKTLKNTIDSGLLHYSIKANHDLSSIEISTAYDQTLPQADILYNREQSGCQTDFPTADE